jgi:hypothetical protein
LCKIGQFQQVGASTQTTPQPPFPLANLTSAPKSMSDTSSSLPRGMIDQLFIAAFNLLALFLKAVVGLWLGGMQYSIL